MTQGDYIEGDDVQKFLDYKYVRLRQKLAVSMFLYGYQF